LFAEAGWNNEDLTHDIFAQGAAMDGVHMDEIAAFLSVVEARSFTGAGRLLGRDASIISRRVSALEGRLGVRLLERSTRHVAPTEAGVRLNEQMVAANLAMREAEAEATQTSGVAFGTLRLALPAAFGRLWIAPLLPAFLAAHPGVSLDVDYADRYVDVLAEGFDVAIRLGELTDSRLVAKRLASHRRMIFASPGYVAAHGAPRSPNDLHDHICLANSGLAGHPEWRFRRDEHAETIRVRGLLVANDAQSLLTAALMGTGILMCSDWLAARDWTAGRLERLLPDWTIAGAGNAYAVRPAGRFTPGKTRCFVNWISAQLEPAPWTAA
jgi:DNA-binding transcriptional LysR family regulator